MIICQHFLECKHGCIGTLYNRGGRDVLDFFDQAIVLIHSDEPYKKYITNKSILYDL